MAKTHEKLLKLLIREHADLSLFHARAAEKLAKDLAAWKRNCQINTASGKL
jgi:hypothetical protein